ncbi:dihydrodipicolinate synthase family protein [Lacticaseibacillus baoqingensis]|uniref:Dihydrodipicolinate synthase family protein n=1 Tax=Lacticaseibacillus baoqingensis TaxID=2486013 RepID=A0ABW4E7H0_9LACO|nr:dihydrodipicolinate synthase family protein [Lacticaseibacillus baoqingensis]
MAEIIVPVVTVFDKDEKPDYEGNQHVIDYLIRNGVDGILVLGSAGEFSNLTLKEKIEFFDFYSEYVDGRVKLLAGTGCVSYAETKQLTQAALDMGYEAAVVIEPYYFAISQVEVEKFYDRLADEINGNIYIYNFPARSGVSIDPATVNTLMKKHANITGLKDSVTTPGHTNMILQAIAPVQQKIYSGFDDQFLANIASGGQGCIGALANVVPDIWHALVVANNQGNYQRTMQLFGLIERLMPIYDVCTNPAVILKRLMKHRGVAISAQGLFPFTAVDEGQYLQAEKLLDEVVDEFLKPSVVVSKRKIG